MAQRAAIVTGASSGIGLAIARMLGEEGYGLTLAARRPDKLAAAADELRGAGYDVLDVAGPLSEEDAVRAVVAGHRERFGRLDVLVNNAGVYQFGALEEVTTDEYRRQFDTNVLGPILATREALKLFPAEGGSVINVSSIASEKGMAGLTIYGATKGALDQVTRSHAIELAPRKIRVNTIAPGGVDTEGTRSAGIIGSDMEAQMVAGTPLGRIGRPDDVADVAVFLASDASRWVTGDRIRVAGGFR